MKFIWWMGLWAFGLSLGFLFLGNVLSLYQVHKFTHASTQDVWDLVLAIGCLLIGQKPSSMSE
jgi:hypothetical protein